MRDTPEIERLKLDHCKQHAGSDDDRLNCYCIRHANGRPATTYEVMAHIDAQAAEIERLRDALVKIDAIRNDIIGRQRIGWSSHVYPMVEALGEAGFEGMEYENAKALAAKAQEPNAELCGGTSATNAVLNGKT